MARIIVLCRARADVRLCRKLNQKQGDPFVDSRPNATIRWVKGVVEVEDPGRDVAKASAQRLVRRQACRRRDQGAMDKHPFYASISSVTADHLPRLATP